MGQRKQLRRCFNYVCPCLIVLKIDAMKLEALESMEASPWHSEDEPRNKVDEVRGGG